MNSLHPTRFRTALNSSSWMKFENKSLVNISLPKTRHVETIFNIK